MIAFSPKCVSLLRWHSPRLLWKVIELSGHNYLDMLCFLVEVSWVKVHHHTRVHRCQMLQRHPLLWIYRHRSLFWVPYRDEVFRTETTEYQNHLPRKPSSQLMLYSVEHYLWALWYALARKKSHYFFNAIRLCFLSRCLVPNCVSCCQTKELSDRDIM